MPRRKVGIRTVAPSSDWSEMLKHLWRSLIAVRRQARPDDLEAYELQIAQYKTQLNAYQLQQRDAASNGQSVEALQAMVATLQQMIENSKPLRVARYCTYAFTDDEGTVR